MFLRSLQLSFVRETNSFSGQVHTWCPVHLRVPSSLCSVDQPGSEKIDSQASAFWPSGTGNGWDLPSVLSEIALAVRAFPFVALLLHPSGSFLSRELRKEYQKLDRVSGAFKTVCFLHIWREEPCYTDLNIWISPAWGRARMWVFWKLSYTPSLSFWWDGDHKC